MLFYIRKYESFERKVLAFARQLILLVVAFRLFSALSRLEYQNVLMYVSAKEI